MFGRTKAASFVLSCSDDFLQQINILQQLHVCAACPLLQKCLVRFADGWNQVTIEVKQVRLINRLRVRSRPAVFSSIPLKVAGWNLLRAESVRSLIAKLTKGG